jgi:hypothetical protein
VQQVCRSAHVFPVPPDELVPPELDELTLSPRQPGAGHLFCRQVAYSDRHDWQAWSGSPHFCEQAVSPHEHFCTQEMYVEQAPPN